MKKLIKLAVLLAVCILTIGAVGVKLKANKEQMLLDQTIPENVKKEYPVIISTASEISIQNNISENGIFKPVLKMTFASDIQGRIKSLNISKGGYLKKNDLILTIEDEILNLESQQAQLTVQKLKADVARLQRLVDKDAIPVRELEEAKLAYQTSLTQTSVINSRMQKNSLSIPMSGFVEEKHVEKGSYIMPGSPILELVNTNTLLLNVQVYEADIIKIKKEQKVTVIVDIFPDEVFKGKVQHISIQADEARRYTLEIAVPNTKNRIKPGMSATATFEFGVEELQLTIPQKSIVNKNEEFFVMVINDEKEVEQRKIKIGKSIDGKINVLEGLEKDEKIIVTGHQNLPENASIVILGEE